MQAKHLQSMAVFLVLVLLFAGCGKKPKPSADSAVKGPAWVTRGSGAFEDEDGKVFYGVGAASGISDKVLLRQTADNRARAEIAKILETYVAMLSKDYLASTSSGEMKKASEEQRVEIALKTFTKTKIRGAQIVDRWMDPADKIMYSLCKLDLLLFKKALHNYENLDQVIREHVGKNADKLHEELQKLENR